jgi:hypothetical protein
MLWARTSGGEDYANTSAIETDTDGNIYAAGYFSSPTLTFGSIVLTKAGFTDIYFVKYDTDGNVVWAKSMGVENYAGANIAVDNSGNIFVAGGFANPVITIGTTILTNTAADKSYDIFIAKYNSDGDVLWAKKAGGPAWENAYSIAVDGSGKLLLAGWFASPSITFGTQILHCTSLQPDIFIAKYDTWGNALWATSEGGIFDDEAFSVDVDAAGNIYLAGKYNSPTLSLGLATLSNTDISCDTHDIFLAKTSNSSGLNESGNQIYISAFPNPASDNIRITISEKATIEILNIEGRIMKAASQVEEQTTIKVQDLPAGVYILKARSEEKIAITKFIIQ